MTSTSVSGGRGRVITRLSQRKTLRAQPFPSQQRSSITCSLIQNQVKFYAQTVALKKVGTYVDIEFETREHAMFVINNFTPSDFHLKLAPSNITGLPMICPGEVYLRSRRRDHTPDSVEDSVSLPWNNPLPTEWRIPANSVGDLLRAYPTHPQSIRRDPIDPVKPFEESLWPSLY